MPYIGAQPTTSAFITDTFNGNGSTTAFTMSAAPANTNSILVAISGVLQDPSTYSVNATTLTFSAAPPSGTGNISVRFLGIPASGVVTTAYRTQTEFTATAGQTTFSVPSYTVGYIDVYRNGVLLGSADFTATNGTTVVLTAGASAGDLIETVSFYVSSVVNAIPAQNNAVVDSYILSMAGSKLTGSQSIPKAALPTGSVLQVIRSDYTTLASTTNTASWSNIGSATITPQSASNKILITATYHVSGIGALRLLRNSTALNTPTNTYMTYSYYPAAIIQSGYNSNSDRQIVSMQYYDSPSTTASTTYNVEMIAYSISQTIGIGVNELYTGVPFSGITLMEIAA